MMGNKKESPATAEQKYVVLAIYDISDNRRRASMVKCLESYGIRVQKSAFETNVTRRQYETMSTEAGSLIDAETDSLRFYFLPKDQKALSFGQESREIPEVYII